VVPVDSTVHPPVAIAMLAAAGTFSTLSTRVATTVEGSARSWRTTPPTLASVEQSRSRSIAVKLNIVEPASGVGETQRTLLAAGSAPTSVASRSPVAQVNRPGGIGRARLAALTESLIPDIIGAAQRAPGTPGATIATGEVAVLRLPNALRDVGDNERPTVNSRGVASRLVALGNGGTLLADRDLSGSGQDPWPVAVGTERIAVIALGETSSPERGLAGWHAGMHLPYLGWSTAIGSRCTVRSQGTGLLGHNERGDAGWLIGAELARGNSTVATRFSMPVNVVVIVLDDHGAFTANPSRHLSLGIDGATRALDVDGKPRPPVAYDVVPSPNQQEQSNVVTITVASETGWSLAGVLASTDVSGASALALIASRGLDDAVRPLVPGNGGSVQLIWVPAPEPIPPTPVVKKSPAVLKNTTTKQKSVQTKKTSGATKKPVELKASPTTRKRGR
jgi:large repetitive protein